MPNTFWDRSMRCVLNLKFLELFGHLKLWIAALWMRFLNVSLLYILPKIILIQIFGLY